MIEDNFRHKGLRKQLVEELRKRDICNNEILEAINKIPRHLFIDNAFTEFAYQDVAFPIGSGQTISQPSTVAFQTALLSLKKNDKVLEIGTGSGYQTAVLYHLGVKIFSIERQKDLFTKTKSLLEKLNINAKLYYGDGFAGLPTFAPFQKILVTAGAPFVPPALIEQLSEGGKLVIPVNEGDDQVQIMHEITKENGKINTIKHGEFKFVPMLEEKAGSNK